MNLSQKSQIVLLFLGVTGLSWSAPPTPQPIDQFWVVLSSLAAKNNVPPTPVQPLLQLSLNQWPQTQVNAQSVQFQTMVTTTTAPSDERWPEILKHSNSSSSQAMTTSLQSLSDKDLNEESATWSH